jgi:predicted phage baseplate assembly protein
MLKGLPGKPQNPIDETDRQWDWMPKYDLMESSGQEQSFVAEMDNSQRAHLRFGDNELGMMPGADTVFSAIYRVGNGPAGNIGAESIAFLVLRKSTLGGVSIKVRNPLPSHGGTNPELITEAKLRAPNAFHRVLERAITAEDYALLAGRHPGVQGAGAALQWTGSWYEARVAFDPFGTEEANDGSRNDIRRFLHPYRRMGHDLAVTQAVYVPLLIEMKVCVLPNYLRGHVELALLELFSNRALAGGGLGFFHPDNQTFGEGVYLSRLVAAAQAVQGVESVTVTKLERLYQGPNHEIENGILPLGPTEIARLDNDPSFPENGKLTLVMGGGR